MYQPSHHREDDLGVQHALIRDHPLGLLITAGSEGLEANPVPFVLDPDGGPKGRLRGHIARANRQWRDADTAIDALVVFQGPNAYVTPSWYATKAQTGKVVPTWNYAIVQAHGTLRITQDPSWLRAQIEALTGAQEAEAAEPWHVSDAPRPYVDAMIRGIVGLEIAIIRIDGKWKVSQNRPEADRVGVVKGLRDAGGPDQLAMANLVEDAPLKR